jgi:hypothetical protein
MKVVPFAFGAAAMVGLRMVASSPVVDSRTVVLDADADAEVRTCLGAFIDHSMLCAGVLTQ